MVKVGWKFCASPVYPDGMPLGFDKSAAGDGTVLMSSAILGSGVSYGSPKTEEHAKLVKAFACDAAAFINGESPMLSESFIEEDGCRNWQRSRTFHKHTGQGAAADNVSDRTEKRH